MASKAQKMKKAAKKKPAKSKIKASSPTAKKNSSKLMGAAGAVKAGISAVQAFLPGRTSKAQAQKFMGGFGRKRTAKQALKKAYERRAMRKIRQGNLGQARRDLRKKATVV